MRSVVLSSRKPSGDSMKPRSWRPCHACRSRSSQNPSEDRNPVKISVIGAGYVGLTTAACLAEIGHDVRCADNDETKLTFLPSGQMPFFEPHLKELVLKNCKAGRLRFDATESAVVDTEVIYICVGTPPLENGEADLSAIANVARTIAQRATGSCLVI